MHYAIISLINNCFVLLRPSETNYKKAMSIIHSVVSLVTVNIN